MGADRLTYLDKGPSAVVTFSPKSHRGVKIPLMDFRAAKIVLAVFLFIAFAIPFTRMSGTVPTPEENGDLRNALNAASATANPSMAFTVHTVQNDSTSRAFRLVDVSRK